MTISASAPHDVVARKADLLPLDGKYYGTRIKAGEGEIVVWGCWTRGEPSARELVGWAPLSDDPKDRAEQMSDILCDRHYEDAGDLIVARAIIAALNGQPGRLDGDLQVHLLPLDGKYHGTRIKIGAGEITVSGCERLHTPSEREIASCGGLPSDPLEREALLSEMIADDRCEDAGDLAVAEQIVAGLTGRRY